MGLPVKIVLNSQPVFLCCKGCERQARGNPTGTLAEVERRKAAGRPGPPAGGAPNKTPGNLAGGAGARIRAALATLSPEDRGLAEAQGYCPIQNGTRLGSMGTPFKVEIEGQPVFLCCDGCEEEARAHPDQTLAAVRRLKANGQPAPSP
jgi:hypothetical protein